MVAKVEKTDMMNPSCKAKGSYQMGNQAAKARIEQGSTTNRSPRCRVQVNSKWEISLKHNCI